MKKIDLILNGKIDAKLTETKKAKITKAIEVAILNAEDDLLSKKLEYERETANLALTHSYDTTLGFMIAYRQEQEDIERFIATLKDIQADLNKEVEE
jgi:hypothetical protein